MKNRYRLRSFIKVPIGTKHHYEHEAASYKSQRKYYELCNLRLDLSFKNESS
nr:hypothetical protein [uncultured Prevotella sp.]